MTREKSPKGRPPAAETPPPPQIQRAVTIHDVAAMAGVSAMTVSNVINGRARSARDETRQRVLAAVAALNYRPASSGRNLRLGRRYTIGVVVVDVIRDVLSSPFTWHLLSGLCGVLNGKGYVVMVQGIRYGDFESSFPLRQAGADAYCVRLTGQAAHRTAMLKALERVQEPMILVHETLPLLSGDRMIVRQDDFGGARALADHLRVRGAHSVALLGPSHEGPMTTARLAGFRAGLADAEISVICAHANDFESGLAATGDYLDAGNRPDAIACTNDSLAIAAMRAAQERGLRVPQDLMVTGFNGFMPPFYVWPSLTTAVSRTTDLGVDAAEFLIRRLSGHPFETKEHVLPISIRDGQSTLRTDVAGAETRTSRGEPEVGR